MKKQMISRVLILFVVFGLFVGMTGCTDQAKTGKGPITVASLIDSEGTVLGNMILAILRENGFEAIDKLKIGTPEIQRQAIIADEVDVIIDYTGSGQYYGAVAEESVWSDSQMGYEATRDFDLAQNNLYWLSPAPANNTEMIALNREFAESNAIADMYDFAAYVNGGGDVKLICASSFAENELGLIGYQKAYGFLLGKDQLIVLNHGNTSEMLKALYSGTDGVNASLVYGTDGSLDNLNMIAIDDPIGVPPVYLPAPVVRGEIIETYPEIQEMFTAVFDTLTKETLQILNSKVAFAGEDPKIVAEDYLRDKGFIE
ncbi:MAG: ABC transporter substrate-binding protein [Clostridia bacterium]|nr:ABC transporter substrate-binding protein [Clostridia bacterium]